MRRTMFLILLAALTGCRAQKIARSGRTVSSADTVVVRETVRDTVVTIEGDSAMIRALLECDSIGQVHINRLLEYEAGERLRPPKVAVKNNILTASAQIDSMAIYLQLKDRYESRIKATDTTTVIVEQVNRLTWWQGLWVRMGQWLTALTVLYILYKVYKPKILKLWQK